MNTKLPSVVLLHILMLAGCSGISSRPAANSTEELPMYGSDNPALVSQGYWDAIPSGEAYANSDARERAVRDLVERGFTFYNVGKYKEAIKSLNQAWVLDRGNPQIYWGFALVLRNQRKLDQSYKMAARSYELDFRYSSFLADFGAICVLRSITANELSNEQKDELIAQAEDYYQKAAQSGQNLGYVYESWATSRCWLGDYEGSWKLIRLSERHGGTPSSSFFLLLGSKLPEPPTPPGISVSTSLKAEPPAWPNAMYIKGRRPQNPYTSLAVDSVIRIGTVLILQNPK